MPVAISWLLLKTSLSGTFWSPMVTMGIWSSSSSSLSSSSTSSVALKSALIEMCVAAEGAGKVSMIVTARIDCVLCGCRFCFLLFVRQKNRHNAVLAFALFFFLWRGVSSTRKPPPRVPSPNHWPSPFRLAGFSLPSKSHCGCGVCSNTKIIIKKKKRRD